MRLPGPLCLISSNLEPTARSGAHCRPQQVPPVVPHPRASGIGQRESCAPCGPQAFQDLKNFCQDSGLAPEQRKRKERNPNPARGNATSPHDEEPKRSKRSTPPKSKLTPEADSDRNGSSLIDRISSSTS
ncbi:hypothetical protein PTTG_29661, partial [Puccinia triticina 1-1 BBBD Race 1]